jgi:hypothetical protein
LILKSNSHSRRSSNRVFRVASVAKLNVSFSMGYKGCQSLSEVTREMNAT